MTWWSRFPGIRRSGQVVSQVSLEKAQRLFFWIARVKICEANGSCRFAQAQRVHSWQKITWQFCSLVITFYLYKHCKQRARFSADVTLHIYISPFIIIVLCSVKIVLIFLFSFWGVVFAVRSDVSYRFILFCCLPFSWFSSWTISWNERCELQVGLSSLEMWITAGLQLKSVWACPQTSSLTFLTQTGCHMIRTQVA